MALTFAVRWATGPSWPGSFKPTPAAPLIAPPSGTNPVVTGPVAIGADGVLLASDPVTLPLVVSRGRLLLRVALGDGVPRLFALDTGTTWAAVLDRSVEASLADRPPVIDRVSNRDAADVVRERPLVRLPTLDLGGARLEGVPALVDDLSWVGTGYRGPLAGLIGAGLFATLTATIDVDGARLSLSTARLPEAGSWAWDPDEGPMLPVAISAHRWLLLVDTGTAGGMTLPADDARTASWRAQATPAGQAVTSYGRRQRWRYALEAPPRLVSSTGRDAPSSLAPPGVPLPVDEVVLVEGREGGLLGTDALRRHVLVLDGPARRVALRERD